jgi:hypothetical protein
LNRSTLKCSQSPQVINGHGSEDDFVPHLAIL